MAYSGEVWSLATLSKLKQVCNHPAQFLGDNFGIRRPVRQATRLTEMLEEVIEVGDRALVFSQFAEMGGLLQRQVQETFGLEALFLHGGVPKRRRDRMVERFQDEGGGPQVFILSLKAGGAGLNLTVGQPRLPLRPLVEPCRRGPGNRPGIPHRPDAKRPGPQVHLRRNAGGEDRRDDRAQEGNLRTSRGSG